MLNQKYGFVIFNEFKFREDFHFKNFSLKLHGFVDMDDLTPCSQIHKIEIRHWYIFLQSKNICIYEVIGRVYVKGH